ncbi:MAG: Periplasmic pH-dependent serine endoprotease DegQ [Candidatus Anoxychlamydiales bacterium]|nr:Periplasmic pH-dependent serine endoprotease DegQ [Candidatus Anoxychlamydiales bacterium]
MSRLITCLMLTTFALFSPFSDVKGDDISCLKETSKAFSQVGKKAIPAVVFINAHYNGSKSETSKSEDSSESFNFFSDEFLKKFFGSPEKDQPQYAAGSGCLVSKNGYILTNNHIIKDAENIIVTLNDGKDYTAKIIGTDPKTDLAIIKIEANNLPFLEFANSEALEIGEWAVAIGAPFQLQASLTVGVISAKGRQNLRITDLEDFIQTDAAINPGNSGGPLLDLDAKIAGINTALVSQAGRYMGLGFAIPANMAKHVMEQIIDNGTVKRGFLGIILQPLDKEMADALDLASLEGALIAEVSKKSPAQKAGLKQGDIIIAYNDIHIKNMRSFRKEMSLLGPGDKVKITVLRNGKKKNFMVTLGESKDSHVAHKQSLDIGIEVSDIKDIEPQIVKKWQYSDALEGVMITSVKYHSIAEKAGLKPGMVTLKLNHKKVKNINDFNEALKDIDKKRYILMLVKYQNVTKFITIKRK